MSLNTDQLSREAMDAETSAFGSNSEARLRTLLRRLRKELHDVHEALSSGELRREALFRVAADGALEWDLRSDRVRFSPRWWAALGLDPVEAEVGVALWKERIHPDDRARVEREITQHLEGATAWLDSEHRLRHEDGSWRWMGCHGLAIRDHGGRAQHLVAIQSDRTEEVLARARMKIEALRDGLTGLPNRALFVDRLEHAIRRCRHGSGGPFAVLLLDLDRFNLVNDSLGHGVGDRLLVAVAERIRGVLQPLDTFARLGADEFAILLEDLPPGSDLRSAATERARGARQALLRAVRVDAREIFVSASVGMVCVDPSYRHPEEVLRDADTALHAAKDKGGNRHALFDKRMHARAQKRLALETDLRHALERGELRLHYQPIVDLQDGRIAGFEALARWAHPHQGLLRPPAFIPLAEETGLIRRIGRWVLREACRCMGRWSQDLGASGPAWVSVNLSPRELVAPDFASTVAATLREARLSASHLHIEITESTLMENPDLARYILGELKTMGVALSIDDFGTGYSSLSALHSFPIDTLKIDRGFISRLGTADPRPPIVDTIATLAKQLGLLVVAEGVETPAQLESIRSLGCQYGQGFLFAGPRSERDAATLFRSDRTW